VTGDQKPEAVGLLVTFPIITAMSKAGLDRGEPRISFSLLSASGRDNWVDHLKGRVDPKQCTGPLAMYCFMTGFM
jgi:hypothetical protein